MYLIIHFNFANFVKLYECGFEANWTSPCKFWLFMHHFFSTFLLKAAFMLDHYPLYLMFPFFYHPWTITHPGLWCHKWLYGLGLVIHNHYPLCFLKEYRKNKAYIVMVISVWLIAITGIMVDIVYPCNAGYTRDNEQCWTDPVA